MLAASAAFPLVGGLRLDPLPAPARPVRIRTITAGVGLKSAGELQRVDAAITVLKRLAQVFTDDGYEVQTIRIATTPFLARAGERARDAALPALRALDELVGSRDARIAIGPVLAADRPDPHLAGWAAELAKSTRSLNFTVSVASAERGPAPHAARAAAEAMQAIASGTPGGLGNFRFAAAASVPPGTPFFPVAYHDGPDTLAIGLESASVVEEAFTGATGSADAGARLRERLDDVIAPVERTALGLARREGRIYLGVDPSPAPGKDRSIGAAVEALTKRPFGDASTLDACATITAALKSLRARTCGYAGLMLPVLEDPVLARRATEKRYGIGDLLLFSSVCGTGLDVVPIPGDTPVEVMSRIVLDVAALSARLRKPLSARLFPIPGRSAGETAHFDDPLLTDCAVMAVQ
jgi:uncharacterized protein (UPF0210 family)